MAVSKMFPYQNSVFVIFLPPTDLSSLSSLSHLISFSGTVTFLNTFRQWNANWRIYPLHTNFLVPLYVINHYIQDPLLEEYNLPNFLPFVDYENAFDRVNRNKLWNVVMERGFWLLAPGKSSTKSVLWNSNNNWKRKRKRKGKNYMSRCKTRVPIIAHLAQPYLDEVIRWQIELEDKFCISVNVFSVLRVADDWVYYTAT
jgi:hypothetical protein